MSETLLADEELATAEGLFMEGARYRGIPKADAKVLWNRLAATLSALAAPTVPAGDEREGLAAIIHEPCVERWRHRGKAGYGVVTMHGIDAHYELADRLLAAGVRLTEGGNNPASEIGYEDERTMGTGS